MKITAFLFLLPGAVVSAFGFTPADADAAFHSYNTHFYRSPDGLGFYEKATSGGGMGFWTEAEEIEMIEDAYDRTGSADCRRMISESIAGFTNHFSSDWTKNKYNDDIMWMTIACVRGYRVTNNRMFLDLAKKHFKAVCARGWDDKLGGGIWWSTDCKTKNACINGPASLAASLLYQCSGDDSYLTAAKDIYAWERKSLFNAATGAVADNMKSDGSLGKKVFTYNLGTFIGAANLLWKITGETNYFEDAIRAARFTRDTLCIDGILPAYGSGDAAGFNGIFVRWMARFARDNRLWPEFHDWMSRNANAAWSIRRADGLSWQKWNQPTPAEKLDSWNCSDTVVILQVTPPKRP